MTAPFSDSSIVAIKSYLHKAKLELISPTGSSSEAVNYIEDALAAIKRHEENREQK